MVCENVVSFCINSMFNQPVVLGWSDLIEYSAATLNLIQIFRFFPVSLYRNLIHTVWYE